MYVYVNAPLVLMICIYVCINWSRWGIFALRESVQQYLCNSIRSSIKRTCAMYRSKILYRFLQRSTKSTNAYNWEHTVTVCGSPGHANLLIKVYLSAACNLHITSETIITSQLTSYLHWFSMVAKENRLQTRVRCTNTADLVLQMQHQLQNLSLSGFLCASELPSQPRWPMVPPTLHCIYTLLHR